ncbi:MAG TPA: ribonuclease H-like domain-containing protein [Spirochaetia bacterium]|nr:ribonuclease H-like domain-containing protein [Spirochaetales bacterium]HRY79723.1 ribonuclease H-like domain-containing protein [Spirochaetia bacterium]HRZ88202.1 ribonuclease H-like domain-containing protein [Spirochaetia bacterium]
MATTPESCRIPAGRLLFLDLETTGLSGGAGTIAFLAGLGRVVPGGEAEGFEIRQYLLIDYPGEDAFLDALLGALVSETVLASYNGRSFDEPLLRTRCILNRKHWPPHPHADFLPAARRLWRKRFPDCSLGTLEALMLKRQRSLDVPGARIPEIWFEYAKRGSHPLMEAVLEHNAADVESLAAIAAECARTYANPVDARDCDRTALGTLWLKLQPDTGRAVLERAFEEGEERAGWMLLRHYRRNGVWAEYRRVLSALSPGWDSWIERAKDAEHRLGDPRAALQAARSARVFAADTELREHLELRIRRLTRKTAAIRQREDRTSRPR